LAAWCTRFSGESGYPGDASDFSDEPLRDAKMALQVFGDDWEPALLGGL